MLGSEGVRYDVLVSGWVLIAVVCEEPGEERHEWRWEELRFFGFCV